MLIMSPTKVITGSALALFSGWLAGISGLDEGGDSAAGEGGGRVRKFCRLAGSVMPLSDSPGKGDIILPVLSAKVWSGKLAVKLEQQNLYCLLL